MNVNRIEPQTMSKAAIRAAEDAMQEVDPDASDEAIAEVLADYLTTPLSGSRAFHLSIFHDVKLSSVARLARLRKSYPGYEPHEPVGPCPLPYHWSRKNIVGIATRDRDRARQWIIEAALAGYGVFRHFSSQGSAFVQGLLEAIRTRRHAVNRTAGLLGGETTET